MGGARIGRIFWGVVFVVGSLILIARVVLSFFSEYHSTPHVIEFIVLIICFYSLFLLEGLGAAAMQLNTQDAAALEKYLADNFVGNKLLSMQFLVRTFTKRFQDFIIGKQMLAMGLIVFIALLVGAMGYSGSLSFERPPIVVAEQALAQANQAKSQAPKAGSPPKTAPSPAKSAQVNIPKPKPVQKLKRPVISPFIRALIAILPGWLAYWLFTILYNPITTFLIATLLPCWMCQLLPHLMAERRGIQFMQIPPASAFAYICLWVASLGAGGPANTVFGIVQKTNRFKQNEYFPVSEQTIYERLQSHYGFSVESRVIELFFKTDATIITDLSNYVFATGQTDAFRHLIRIRAEPACMPRKVVWKSQLPHDLDSDELEPKFLLLYIDQMDGSGTLQDTTAVSEEHILASEAAFAQSLPRKGRAPEVGWVRATYEMDALAFGARGNKFIFDITRPTKLLEFTLKVEEGYFVREPPQLSFIAADELQALGESQPLNRVQFRTERRDGDLVILIDYPPIHSRAILEIDVRAKRTQVK